MKEIVQIQVGLCGNNIACGFWEKICQEHRISLHGQVDYALQIGDIGVYFSEKQGEKYVPRSVVIDAACNESYNDSFARIRESNLKGLFDEQCFVELEGSARGNWCVGSYEVFKEEGGKVLDAVRKQVEACEKFQGFQMFMSLGGGLGSGFGSSLLYELQAEYLNKTIQVFSGVYAAGTTDRIVEPYNTILGLQNLIEVTQGVFLIDNQALYKTCTKTLNIPTPSQNDLNHIIAQAISHSTLPLRFNLNICKTLSHFTSTLVPFPRMHFFTMSLAPIGTQTPSCSHSPIDLGSQLFRNENTLCDTDITKGHFLASVLFYRGGRFDVSAVEESLNREREIQKVLFVDWIQDNFIWEMCEHDGWNESAGMVGNTTAVNSLFRRVLRDFQEIWKRKAFVHCYTGVGMDKMEFESAESNAIDLIDEYDSLDN